MISERKIYKNVFHYFFNQILFPMKMLIPQPIISYIPGLLTNHSIRTQIVLRQVEGRLLDIGCGKNELVKQYRANGGKGCGVDIHDWGEVDLLVKDTSALPLEDKSVDTITLVACLNHIPNRNEVLHEAKRILKNDGKLIITNLSPVISRIWHAWAFWDNDQNERGMKDGEVYGFTETELITLLKAIGFVVVEKQRFSWNLNSIYVCNVNSKN